jgi:hypothetical protein
LIGNQKLEFVPLYQKLPEVTSHDELVHLRHFAERSVRQELEEVLRVLLVLRVLQLS